jgi:hypothetical protein
MWVLHFALILIYFHVGHQQINISPKLIVLLIAFDEFYISVGGIK